jgi:hypothetical protein
MNDPPTQPPFDPHSRAGHETSDASPFYVGLFSLGLVLMIALVLPLLGWIFWRLEAAAVRKDPAQSPLAGNQVPPEPRLQTEPAADLASVRHEEDKRLSSYGWIDPQQHVVRVPIERAIQILAEHGLPEPAGPVEPVDPVESAKQQERAP